METKINLDQCQIEESTEEYKIQKLDTQGNFITERLPLYNLTAEEELNADIQVEKRTSENYPDRQILDRVSADADYFGRCEKSGDLF